MIPFIEGHLCVRRRTRLQIFVDRQRARLADGAPCPIRAAMTGTQREGGLEDLTALCYDDALAETINGHTRPNSSFEWRNFEAVEFTTLVSVVWFIRRRLLQPTGTRWPPVNMGSLTITTTSEVVVMVASERFYSASLIFRRRNSSRSFPMSASLAGRCGSLISPPGRPKSFIAAFTETKAGAPSVGRKW